MKSPEETFAAAAARTLYGTTLSRLLKPNDPLTCGGCSNICVPGVTCSMRLRKSKTARAKTKRGRERQKNRAAKYLASVVRLKGEEFVERECNQFQVIECWHCRRTTVKQLLPSVNSSAKSRKLKKQSEAALIVPGSSKTTDANNKIAKPSEPAQLNLGLSLNNFLL